MSSVSGGPADLVGLFEEVPELELKALEKLLQIRDVRLSFALDHHLNTRGDRMDFGHYPHIRQLYESTSREIVLQGSVQSFKSEWAVIDHFPWPIAALVYFTSFLSMNYVLRMFRIGLIA